MLREGVSQADTRKHLVSGLSSAISIRVPDTLRDATKGKAVLKGMRFPAYVREQPIEDLARKDA